MQSGRWIGAGAALVLLAGCGDQAGTQQAALDEAAAPEAPVAPDGADRPLNLDLGSDQATIRAEFSPETLRDPALYDLLRRQAENEAAEARALATEDAAWRAEEDIPFHMHEMAVEWTTAFANERVISLLNTTYVFQGGAHPNAYFSSILWLPEESRELEIGELIGNPEGFHALSVSAEAGLMAQKRERMGDGLSDDEYWREDIIYATAPDAENFALFTLVPSGDPERAGGIELHYAPYAVGPYAQGSFHVVIPQAEFAAYVAPDFAGLFSGAPAPGAGTQP